MLFDLLVYVLLGLVLTVPTWRLLLLVGQRTGWWTARLHYLQPYVVKNQVAASLAPAAGEPE